MSSKARGSSYPYQDIHKLQRDIKFLFSQMRVVSPQQTMVPFITGQHAASAPTGYNALKIAGDTMIGPFALNNLSKSTSTISSKGHLNISQTTGAFGSNVIVNTAPTSGNLSYIDGAAWDGQILKIHVISGQSLIIKDDGNIVPFSAGFTVTGPAVVNFIFDSTLGPNGNAGGWIQETSGSSSGGGAGTLWSNITIDTNKNMLAFSLQNLDFISFNAGNTEKVDGIAATGIRYSVPTSEGHIFTINSVDIAQILSSPSNRLDMLQHEIVNALTLKFGTTAGAISATVPMLTVNVGGDILANVPTAGTYRFFVNNVEKWDMDVSQLTGPNIVLSNTLTLNNSSADPSSNGVFQRNGVDVKCFSGGAVRNLSDIGAAASGANVFLSNLSNPTAVNVDLLPATDFTTPINFGSSSKRWANLFGVVFKFAAGREIDLDTASHNQILYSVNAGEKHTFQVNAATVVEMSGSVIDIFQNVAVHNKIISDAHSLTFHSSGNPQEIDVDGAGLVYDVFANGFEIFTLSNAINGGTGVPNNGILEVNGSGHLTYTGVLYVPSLKTYNTSAAITNGNFIGGLYFDGNNNATVRKSFAQILAVSDNVSSGSEFGTLHFQTVVGGAMTDIVIINKTSGIAPPTDGVTNLGSSGIGWGNLHLADKSANPTVNGQFQRNGADVYVFTGGVARNLTGLPTAGAADIFLDNLGTTSLNQDLNMNQHSIPNCNFISFDTNTFPNTKLIDGISGTGITYNLPSGEGHFFKVGGAEFVRISSLSGIMLSSFLDLTGNGIQNVGSFLGAGSTESVDIGANNNRFLTGYIKRFSYSKKNSTPNTTDIPDGEWAVYTNPLTNRHTIYLNDGGNFFSVDLT